MLERPTADGIARIIHHHAGGRPLPGSDNKAVPRQTIALLADALPDGRAGGLAGESPPTGGAGLLP